MARLAICSLGEYSHVAEFIDAAEVLSKRHECCYFLGFSNRRAAELLADRGVPHRVLLHKSAESIGLPALDGLRTPQDLFQRYFLTYAELVLPRLLSELEKWKPDYLLCQLRDYAGMTAAEILGVPMFSFGTQTSPVRVKGAEPPFGVGFRQGMSESSLSLLWRLHDRFSADVDALFNERVRRPHGLVDARDTCTQHSRQLVLLGTAAILSNRRLADPDYVHYVGPLSTGRRAKVNAAERSAIARLASSPRPRVFVSMGTVYLDLLIRRCLRGLRGFAGTVVASVGSAAADGLLDPRAPANVIYHSFFLDMPRVLELVDSVVTVAGNKTVLACLQAGRPLVCLPRQGEHLALAYRLQDLGAAEVPCPRQWDDDRFLEAVEDVSTSRSHAERAASLRSELGEYDGIERVSRLVEATIRSA